MKNKNKNRTKVWEKNLQKKCPNLSKKKSSDGRRRYGSSIVGWQ